MLLNPFQSSIGGAIIHHDHLVTQPNGMLLD